MTVLHRVVYFLAYAVVRHALSTQHVSILSKKHEKVCTDKMVRPCMTDTFNRENHVAELIGFTLKVLS
jgi:hypothetical protein